MRAGENGNNQWKWEGNGNKTTLTLGLLLIVNPVMYQRRSFFLNFVKSHADFRSRSQVDDIISFLACE